MKNKEEQYQYAVLFNGKANSLQLYGYLEKISMCKLLRHSANLSPVLHLYGSLT